MTINLANASAHKKVVGTGASASTDMTGADLIVIFVTGSGDGSAVVVSDSKSNSYTALTSRGGASVACGRLFYKLAPVVDNAMTFQVSGMAAGVEEGYWAGFSGVASFDQETGVNNISVVTSLQPGSLTPSAGANGALFVTGLVESGTGANSIDSGFSITDQDTIVGGVHYAGGLAYFVQTLNGALNPTWSWSSNIANQQVASMATFLASGGGGSLMGQAWM